MLGLLPVVAQAQGDAEARDLEEQQAFSPLTTRAERLWADGKYKSARKLFERVEQLSLSSRERAHAILAQGDCYLKSGKEWKAFLRYRKAVDNYSSFIPYNRVLDIEYEIAERHFAGKKGSFLFINYSTREKAREIYDHIMVAAPYSRVAPKAAYRSATMAYDDKDYELAIEKYAVMISTYPRHELAAEARMDLALTLVEYAKLADGDGLLINRANIEIKRFLTLHPEHPRVEEALALQALSLDIEASRLTKLGEFYQRSAHERLPASERYLRQVVGDYAETPSAKRANQLLDRAERKQATRTERDARDAAKAAEKAAKDAAEGGDSAEFTPTKVESETVVPDTPTPDAGGADTARPPAGAKRDKSGKYLLPVTGEDE
jgi:outer membrane protein assembly factor BamD (BamD/ComL family)